MLRYLPLSGRLYMTDDLATPPHVIFDTDEPFLCVRPDDFKAGSQVVPARTASSSGVDGTQTVVDVQVDYLLGIITIPGAKVVRGLMRVTWDSNPEPADNLWRQASGTHLDLLDGVDITRVPQSDTAGFTNVATLGGYTLFVNNLNHLIMRERIVMRARDPGGPPTTFNRARQQATVSFRLLVGFFMQQDFTTKPALAYRGQAYSNTSGSTQNLNFAVAGYEFTGRKLVAVIAASRGSGAGVQASSVTIGGVAATILGGYAGTNRLSLTVASAIVPTGTSLNVSAVFPSSMVTSALALYAGGNITSASISGNDAVGTSVSQSVTVGTAQIGLVAAAQRLGNDGSLTNVNDIRQSGQLSFFPRLTTGVIPPGAGTLTPAASWPLSSDCIIAGAVFS